MWLHGVHIAPYSHGNRANVDPDRKRKLLLHKKEIRYLIGKTKERGYTLVPLKLYFSPTNKVKVELGLARGKKLLRQARHDRRARSEARRRARDAGAAEGRLMPRVRLREIVACAAAFALGALVALFAEGPALFADGDFGERVVVLGVSVLVYAVLGAGGRRARAGVVEGGGGLPGPSGGSGSGALRSRRARQVWTRRCSSRRFCWAPRPPRSSARSWAPGCAAASDANGTAVARVATTAGAVYSPARHLAARAL